MHVMRTDTEERDQTVTELRYDAMRMQSDANFISDWNGPRQMSDHAGGNDARRAGNPISSLVNDRQEMGGMLASARRRGISRPSVGGC